MRKLKLDVEKLEVASFETDGKDGKRGTVGGHGNEPVMTGIDTCIDRTCFSYHESCVFTCGGLPTTCGSITD